MTATLRAGVVGVGYLGAFHAEKYASLDDVDLVAVVDTDRERVAAVASRWCTQGVTDHRALFDRVDCLSLAVPTPLHFPLARDFLAHGIDVLVEKPMTETVTDGRTLVELADNAMFYLRTVPLPMTDKARGLLTPDARAMLRVLRDRFAAAPDWTQAALEDIVRQFAESQTPPLKLGGVAQPLRAALTGSTMSPGIFEVLEILGPDEALRRLAAVVN